ncbi:MAG: hypothetical protein OHK0024_25120 [Thalassobaculales bacterium]
MSLNVALTNAVSGLRASQGQIDVVSRNVSNANTAGYTRKIADSRAVVVAGQGQGVTLAETRRLVDAGLQRDVRTAISTEARLATLDSYLELLEQNFGKPTDSFSIAAKVNVLRSRFEDLHAAPEGLTQQLAVIRQAEEVCRDLASLSRTIQEMRVQTETDIANAVTEVNQALGQIKELNDQIALGRSKNVSTADLEDQRDILVDKVAEQLGVHYVERDDGRVVLMTESSRLLVEIGSFSLDFVQTATITPAQTYAGGTLNGLTLGGIDITSELSQGKLAALFNLRDTRLVQAQQQLDEFARAITVAFQGTGTGLAGTAVELFQDGTATFANTAAATVGYSQRIAVNSVLDTDPWRLREGTNTGVVVTESTDTGSTAVLDTIMSLFDNNQTFNNVGLGTTQTFQEYTAQFVAFQGQERASILSQHEYQEQLLTTLSSKLQNDSGVQVDEEIAHLIALQNAYAASARVVSSIDELFQELLNMKR